MREIRRWIGMWSLGQVERLEEENSRRKKQTCVRDWEKEQRTIGGEEGREGEMRGGGRSCHILSIFSRKISARSCAETEVDAGRESEEICGC